MNLIVCVDENWGIGREGRLLCPIPADLKQFKAHTLGKVVILGRLTLSTFPRQQPLPGRDNIILSHDPAYTVENAQVAHSLDELFALLRPYEEENIYVIGGESVYRLLLPYCQRAYVTRLERDFAADRFLPDLEQEGWQLKESSERFEHEGTPYRFCTYENPKAEAWR
ncbi:MAG: dihydrofolate reductase [Firmicutes bacterium]|nr:dihydrofolate reductase [Bacillota bacterium]